MSRYRGRQSRYNNWFNAQLQKLTSFVERTIFASQLRVKDRQAIGPSQNSSVAAVQSCFCFIIVAAAIVLGIGALFLLFVLLYSQRVASQSCETLGELLHHPHKMTGKNDWHKPIEVIDWITCCVNADFAVGFLFLTVRTCCQKTKDSKIAIFSYIFM